VEDATRGECCYGECQAVLHTLCLLTVVINGEDKLACDTNCGELWVSAKAEEFHFSQESQSTAPVNDEE
jgi:hypothetical protein